MNMPEDKRYEFYVLIIKYLEQHCPNNLRDIKVLFPNIDKNYHTIKTNNSVMIISRQQKENNPVGPENVTTDKDEFKRPKVFISYSYDNEQHQSWVKNLADKLIGNGVQVLLDIYELSVGKDITHFMEKCANADKVVLILTPEYKRKTENREGGAGYEAQIITSALYDKQNSDTFIPVIRGSKESSVPVFIKSKLFIDMSDDSKFEERFIDLLYGIFEVSQSERPALGEIPESILLKLNKRK